MSAVIFLADPKQSISKWHLLKLLSFFSYINDWSSEWGNVPQVPENCPQTPNDCPQTPSNLMILSSTRTEEKIRWTVWIKLMTTSFYFLLVPRINFVLNNSCSQFQFETPTVSIHFQAGFLYAGESYVLSTFFREPECTIAHSQH